jgi:hypothetical protein
MRNPFDFTTVEILDSELNAIHEALIDQAIGMTGHAADEAEIEDIPLVAIFEAILVGSAVSKDLPGNDKSRIPGINFENRMNDGRWIRTKVAWIDNYLIITVHTI